MRYKSIKDLSDTIRHNIWKIPQDIDFIIGIPRSGMIAASMIASYMNVPLIDINSYLKGLKPYGGLRLKYNKDHIKSNKILVVDDTVYNGNAISKVKEQLRNIKQNFIYCCVYLEGVGSRYVNIYLEDLRDLKTYEIVLYEWNIFQHHSIIMNKCCYDLDGVLCVDPPDERNTDEYVNYIKNAKPLFVPKNTIGCIVTYRLIKYKDITENWLKNNGIKYKELIMFNAQSWEERHNTNITPEIYKSNVYKDNKYNLFVESNQSQAKGIFELTSKPVYCVETNYMYNIT